MLPRVDALRSKWIINLCTDSYYLTWTRADPGVYNIINILFYIFNLKKINSEDLP